MAMRKVAGVCDDGDCPTIYVDEETGDVVVQGALSSAVATPPGEGLVRMSAADWKRLLSQLPA